MNECIECDIKETGDKSSVTCGMHKICYKCANKVNIISYDTEKTCNTCNKLFCNKCSVSIGNGIYNSKCAISKELDDLIKCIYSALQIINPEFDIKIATIMAEYGRGFIAICCEVILKNEILFNNIWKFKKRKIMAVNQFINMHQNIRR